MRTAIGCYSGKKLRVCHRGAKLHKAHLLTSLVFAGPAPFYVALGRAECTAYRRIMRLVPSGDFRRTAARGAGAVPIHRGCR